MWQTISRLLPYSHHLLRFGSCSGCSADAGAEQPRTENIINTLRAPVDKELKQKVVPENLQGEWIRLMKRQVLLMPAWTACYSFADSNTTRLYRFYLSLIADCWRRILVRRWESL